LDSKIMEIRLKQWMPIFEEQAKSGLNKQEWCKQNDIKRAAFFKWQRELREYLIEKNGNKFQDQHSTNLVVPATPGFVELAPARSTVGSSQNGCCVKSVGISPATSISIRYGEFSIDLNDDVNELLLSKVLKVMSDVY